MDYLGIHAGAMLYGYLEPFLSARGVPVVRTNTKPANVYFDPIGRVVAIDEELTGDQATKTLAHETGHFVAGHTMGMNSRDVETVGESAAFVVLSHFGIDSSGYTFG
jgi:predicted Zn-dependent protease with MMP-like domain